MNKFIYWTLRILSIIFILFLSLFSLDVFSSGARWQEAALGLLIHNIPALILLAVVIISWKREIVGGIVFILAGLFYIANLFLSSSREWYMLSWSITIAGPAFFIGILYIIGWRKKRINK